MPSVILSNRAARMIRLGLPTMVHHIPATLYPTTERVGYHGCFCLLGGRAVGMVRFGAAPRPPPPPTPPASLPPRLPPPPHPLPSHLPPPSTHFTSHLLPHSPPPHFPLHTSHHPPHLFPLPSCKRHPRRRRRKGRGGGWLGWLAREGGGAEVGGGRREEGVREARWEGFGSVWCGPRCCGSVRYRSGRFDTILGESIVESAMVVRCYETIKM